MTEQTAAPTGRRQWTGRTRGGVIGNWIFIKLLQFGGVRAAYCLLVPVALYFMLCAPTARRASRDYRKRVLGLSNIWRSFWQGYRHFVVFGMILLDRAAIFSGQRHKFHFEAEDLEHIDAALAEGKGLIFLIAHCGAWEAAAQVLPERCRTPLNLVIFDDEHAQVRRLFDRVKQQSTFNVVVADGSAESSLRIIIALRRGEIVAMQADRCIDERGQCVPFFGSAARFPVGPHVVAAISGAPVIPIFAMRERTYRYRILLRPHRYQCTPDRRRDDPFVRQGVQQFVADLERVLRRYPLQWQNFYAFWQDSDRNDDQQAMPPVRSLLPHRGAMVLLDEMIGCDEHSAVCAKTFERGQLGVDGDRVLETALLEAMAQTVAAYHGERSVRLGIEPIPGMLVGARRLRFHRDVRCGQSLRIEAQIVRQLNPFWLCAGRITCGDQVVAEGELKFYVEQPDGKPFETAGREQ